MLVCNAWAMDGRLGLASLAGPAPGRQYYCYCLFLAYIQFLIL